MTRHGNRPGRRLLLAGVSVGLGALALVPLARHPAPALPLPSAPARSPGRGSAAIASQSDAERWFEAQPRVDVPVPRDGAAVLVVKFTDYLCPGCARTHFGYGPVFAKYEARFPGAVKVASLDYPWNTDCNPYAGRTLHPAACDAAVAMALAERAGRARELENWLYANQQQLTPLLVRQAAARMAGGADGQAAAEQAVKGNIALARLLHVRSTPTFFINGVRIDDPLPLPAAIDTMISVELRRAGRLR